MTMLRSLFASALLFWSHICSASQTNSTICPNSNIDGCLDATETTKNDAGIQQASAPSNTCSLYVAPSTLPNGGLGVFTTIPIQKNQVIHEGDVIIPIIDLEYYQEYDDFFNPFLDYQWESSCFGLQFEAQSPYSTSGYAPGLLSMMNTRDDISKTNVKRGDLDYDGYIGGECDESPTCGSMTPYFNSATIASTDIPAGSELFMYYGSDWIESMEDEIDFQSQEQLNTTQSLTLLQETGRCLDAITSGGSTLPFAGRGAFATRNITKDAIITGSPLIHVPYEQVLYLYEYHHDHVLKQDVPDFDEHDGYQLLFGYCYSHSESFMLLCPYGAGVNYMNHNQTLANVKIQWSNTTLNMNDTWLSTSPDELEYQYNPQLAFDYVATRDIQQGEELFLDYGEDFEEYLLEHYDEWEPNVGQKTAQEWNYFHRDEPLRTMKEQDWKIYPTALEMHCHPSVFFGEYKSLMEQGLNAYDLWPNSEKGLVCDVHSRQHYDSGHITYTIHVYHPDYDMAVTRRGVTREFVTMVDRPYMTDWHRRHSIRHWIGIPDEIFPTAWKLNVTDFEDEDEHEEDYDRDADHGED